MESLFLVVDLAGERIALPAVRVESVVELGAVTPIPKAAPHVTGLSALRSRVITIIDTRRAIGVPVTRPAGDAIVHAVIVPIDGHPYGMVVDAVEDVARAGGPVTVRAPLSPHWARVAREMIEIDGTLLPLVDPEALVAGPAPVPA